MKSSLGLVLLLSLLLAFETFGGGEDTRALEEERQELLKRIESLRGESAAAPEDSVLKDRLKEGQAFLNFLEEYFRAGEARSKEASGILARVRGRPDYLKFPLARKVNDRLRSMALWAVQHSEKKIDPADLYELSQTIHENKKEWRQKALLSVAQGTSYRPPDFVSSSKRLRFSIRVDAQGQIYLISDEKVFARGASKALRKGISDKTWEGVAALGFEVEREAGQTDAEYEDRKKSWMRRFNQEKEFLKEISQVPKSGLVKVLGDSTDEIFEELYLRDLWHLFEDPSFHATYLERLDGAIELTEGLIRLREEHDYTDLDIKPPNILYRKLKSGHQFSHGDFGNGVRMRRVGTDRYPVGFGTPIFSAPEMVLGNAPVTKDHDVAREYVSRASTFSLALSTYLLMNGKNHPAVLECMKIFEDGPMVQCQRAVIQRLREQEDAKPKIDYLELLHLKGLEADPRRRLSLKAYATGLRAIKSRANQAQTPQNPQLAEVGISAGVSHQDFEKAFGALSFPEGDLEYLLSLPEGTFALYPIGSGGPSVKIGLAYSAGYGKLVKKELVPLSPGPEDIFEQIHLLKELDVLHENLREMPEFEILIDYQRLRKNLHPLSFACNPQDDPHQSWRDCFHAQALRIAREEEKELLIDPVRHPYVQVLSLPREARHRLLSDPASLHHLKDQVSQFKPGFRRGVKLELLFVQYKRLGIQGITSQEAAARLQDKAAGSYILLPAASSISQGMFDLAVVYVGHHGVPIFRILDVPPADEAAVARLLGLLKLVGTLKD